MMQMIMKGKTQKSHQVSDPHEKFMYQTHFQNGETLVEWTKALVKHVVLKRQRLNLPEDEPAILVLDQHRGRHTFVEGCPYSSRLCSKENDSHLPASRSVLETDTMMG